MVYLLLSGAYYFIVLLTLGSAVISWVPRWRWHVLGRLVFGLTEPLYARIRKVIPPIRIGGGALDLSPVIVLLAAGILYGLLTKICLAMGIIPAGGVPHG